MQRNNLEWLDNWYQRQCNGEWEHQQGMYLQPLDDWGWHLTINLEGTSAVNARPQQVRLDLDTTGGDWIACSIGADRFEGAGDPLRLEQIIGVFRQWVETAK